MAQCRLKSQMLQSRGMLRLEGINKGLGMLLYRQQQHNVNPQWPGACEMCPTSDRHVAPAANSLENSSPCAFVIRWLSWYAIAPTAVDNEEPEVAWDALHLEPEHVAIAPAGCNRAWLCPHCVMQTCARASGCRPVYMGMGVPAVGVYTLAQTASPQTRMTDNRCAHPGCALLKAQPADQHKPVPSAYS